MDAPRWNGAREPEETLKIATIRRQAGQGRVVYIPEVKPGVPKPAAARMTSEYWKLPVNWKELIDDVRWAAGGRLSLEVTAPPTVVAELAHQKQKDELIVHLVNYDVARIPSVRNIGVDLRLHEREKAMKISLISPDEAGTLSLPFSAKDDRVRFVVPRLKTYSLAIVQLR